MAGMMLRAVTVAIFAALLIGGPIAHAGDWYDGEYSRCREGTTVSIVRCIDDLTEGWQARLDQVYEALLARQDTVELTTALEEAQKSWRTFRQTNCDFYGQGPGTIAAVEAAECRRVITSRRARELEQAAGVEPR